MDQATSQKNPKNLQAILDWCAKHRPDLGAVVEHEKNNNGFIMLMQIGFEAGRQFQHDNPQEPMYPNNRYIYE